MSDLTPTPRQLFRMLDENEITREQFREFMAIHARGMIEEMVEEHDNPLMAWVESLKNRRAAARLTREHSEVTVREVFVALSEVAGFPLASFLWNADAPHMPLDCFFRSGKEPVFRVLKLVTAPFMVTADLEYGRSKRREATRERFILGRNRQGRLVVTDRQPLK